MIVESSPEASRSVARETEINVGRHDSGLIVSASQHAMEGMARALSDGFKAVSSCVPMTATGRNRQFG